MPCARSYQSSSALRFFAISPRPPRPPRPPRFRVAVRELQPRRGAAGDAENDLLGTALARPGYVRVRAVTKGLLCESFSVALRCGSSRYLRALRALRDFASRFGTFNHDAEPRGTRRTTCWERRSPGRAMSGCEQLPKVFSANRSPSLCVAVLRDISAPSAISRRGSGPSTTARSRGGRGERLVGNGARQAGLCPGASSYQRSSLRIVLRRSALRFFAISPRPPRFRVAVRDLQPSPRPPRRACWEVFSATTGDAENDLLVTALARPGYVRVRAVTKGRLCESFSVALRCGSSHISAPSAISRRGSGPSTTARSRGERGALLPRG